MEVIDLIVVRARVEIILIYKKVILYTYCHFYHLPSQHTLIHLEKSGSQFLFLHDEVIYNKTISTITEVSTRFKCFNSQPQRLKLKLITKTRRYYKDRSISPLLLQASHASISNIQLQVATLELLTRLCDCT